MGSTVSCLLKWAILNARMQEGREATNVEEGREDSQVTAFENPLVSSHQHLLCVVNDRKLPPPSTGQGRGCLAHWSHFSPPSPPANDHSLETSLKEVVALVAPSPEDEALLVKMIQQETTPHQSYPTLPWSWSFA